LATQVSAASTSTAPQTGVQTTGTSSVTAQPHIRGILAALGPDATEVDLDRAVEEHIAASNEVHLEDIKPFYKEPTRRRKTTTGADVGAAAALLTMANGKEGGKQALARGMGEWADRLTVERRE